MKLTQAYLNEIVKFFFTLQMLNKLYHWNTTSYATHKATDEFNSSLSSIVDKFVEVIIGRYNIKPLVDNIVIEPANLTELGFIEMLKRARTYLENFNTIITDSELLNIRDELLASINQTIYLLRLK